MNEKDKKFLIIILYAVGTAVIFAVLLAVVSVYVFKTDNLFTKRITSVIPVPVAVVQYTTWLSAATVRENLNAVRLFYENQDFAQLGVRVDFTTEDGQRRLKVRERDLLNKMIEDAAIERIAKDHGIHISQARISESIDRYVSDRGDSSAVEKNLMKLYGWDLKTFGDKVVRPSLYKEELEKIFSFANEPTNAMREKIEQAHKELVDGRDFSDVASRYSEGATREQGGDLGWFRKNQLIPELSDAVFELSPGEYSTIIESTLGFHIVSSDEFLTEGSEQLAHVRQILVRKKTFADWLGEQMIPLKFFVLLPGYYWDKESQRVEFRDENMRKFAEDLLQSPLGDPSIF